jgi:FkbM family methyltransferase
MRRQTRFSNTSRRSGERKLNSRNRRRHRLVLLSRELRGPRTKRIIKSLIRRGVRALRRCPIDYRRLSYSQEGEDLILAALFDLEFCKVAGFYVDVGAHHPKRLSNTFLFYMNGWSGINIDAAPGSMLAFQRERPRDVNIEAAVGEADKALTFYEFNEPALNSFCRDRVPTSCFGWTIVRERQLTTTTLAHLLEQHLPPGEPIDFMTVDVEGFDLQVLRSNDWTRFRPAVVLVEDDEAIRSTRFCDSTISSYMSQQGYNCCCKTLLTTFFVDQGQVESTLRGSRVRLRSRNNLSSISHPEFD